ncbi:MAG: phosphotransferase [Clostridia bacterium]
MIYDKTNLTRLVKNFCITGNIVSIEKYGHGHINDTYLVIVSNAGAFEKFVLQKINTCVFKDVVGLMQNMSTVTDYLHQKLIELGKNPDIYSLTIVKTQDGNSYFNCGDGDFYRCTKFINGAEINEASDNERQFFCAGKAFGQFQQLMSDFDASKLFETIPNFHNTLNRLDNLKVSTKKDVLNRLQYCQAEVGFFLDRANYASVVVDGIKNGLIPLRVTHNDTKSNNVLLDLKTNEPLAVLDLDTVMAGSILYDFGDAIRFGASTGVEDEIDLLKVSFSMKLYKAFVEGFISEVCDCLSDEEVNLMYFGAMLMTYECGMRFLTDFLDGDVYFKTSRINHNLDRARTQIKLLSEMETQKCEMKQAVIDVVSRCKKHSI